MAKKKASKDFGSGPKQKDTRSNEELHAVVMAHAEANKELFADLEELCNRFEEACRQLAKPHLVAASSEKKYKVWVGGEAFYVNAEQFAKLNPGGRNPKINEDYARQVIAGEV